MEKMSQTIKEKTIKTGAGPRVTKIFGAALLSTAAIYVLIDKIRFQRSAMAALSEAYLRVTGRRDRYLTKEKAEAFMEGRGKKRLKAPYAPSPVILKDPRLTFETGELPKLIYTPDEPAEATVLFLHGGAFVSEMTRHHELFVAALGRELKARVIAPAYPLAPEHTFDDAVREVLELYREIQKEAKGSGPFVLMGDSAGASLAAGLCVEIGEGRYAQSDPALTLPDRLILISPALDLTLSNPEDDKLEAKDPMLAGIGVRVMAKRWAGTEDPASPECSPLFAGPSVFKGTEVTLFAGTREILYPDIVAFTEHLKEAGIPVRLHIGRDLNHDYPLFPIPEALEAMNQIREAVFNARS